MTPLRRTILACLVLPVVGCAPPPERPPTVGAAQVPAPRTSVTPTPDPATVGANELGDVPVLMYHRIVAHPKSVYDRTPADFRSELERLAKEHYVPVTAGDYTAGRIDIPAGTHPVVLTFDDGDPSQFSLTATGEPAPETAVGILQDVARAHPEFRAVATFYVNRRPFGDPDGSHTLPWLRDHGMDVGNHTLDHTNLHSVNAAEVQREIGGDDAAIRQAAPGVEPTTIALPFGVRPTDSALALAGTGYNYRGAFLVGANPAPSPYATDFARDRIPRIRSQGPDGPDAQFASTVWLDKLASTPDRRYTSDGVPDHIAYPHGTSRAVTAAYAERARPY